MLRGVSSVRCKNYLFCLALIPLVLNAQYLNFDLVYEKALSIEAGLSPEAMQGLLDAQSNVMERVLDCVASTPRQTKAVLVMELDKEGRVWQTWLDPTSATKECFQRLEITELDYKPISLPFYTTIEVELTYE